ncbi:hypothetical protein M0R89_08540 [Halorussus limi]|uniref:Uncharacterized protein n=1 Tax=Halorussus limi TaxID=2938695 RepID=A0A8U0HYY9_9EURY|nr:hypothetical protein [Halorussus limi]UPV76089.1 hypothetical protein M0R89_08540 [Halorussus limi]
MFDADDPGTIINEFLVSIFVPGITLLVAVWASFRLVFNDLLLSVGLDPITPAYGARTFAGGFGRFLLLVAVTAVLLAPYFAVYARFLRGPLRKRGLV